MTRVVLRDRYYVRETDVDTRALHEHYEVPVDSKELCRPQCPLARKRGRFCSTCPSRDIRVKLWQRIEQPSGRAVIALAAGDASLLSRVVRDPEVIDRRPDPKLRSALTWTGKLRDGSVDPETGKRRSNQKHMLSEWRRHTRSQTGGIVISPPRSGKCVVAGTLIRTADGYVSVESLFPEGDVERVGRLGTIQTPDGPAELRGLVSRMVDVTYELLLESGARLRGTPEHPVAVAPAVEGRPRRFTRLADIKGHERVWLPRAPAMTLPEDILSPEDAHFLGLATSLTSPQFMAHDIVLVQDLGEGSADRELRDLVRDRFPDGAFASTAQLGLSGWHERLLRSGDRTWRTFLDAAFRAPDGSRRDTQVHVVDPQLALAMHAHLLGQGVESHMVPGTHDGTALWAEPSTMDAYVREDECRDRGDGIVSVRMINERARVYDVMVPDGHAFLTNGMCSHNTVIGVAAVLATRSRSFITASKIDFLRQFGRRFGEITNLKRLYDRGARPVVLVDPKGWRDGPASGVHVIKKWGPDVDRADVVMFCYQQMLDTVGGRERMRRYVDGKFGLGVGDEIHQAAAACFSRFMNRVNVRRRLGLTATLHRKDGLQRVAAAVMGSVAVVGRVGSDLPAVELLETGVGSSRSYAQWNSLVSFITKSEERNRMIVRQVFRDLRAGKRHCVLIPTIRRDHIHQLVKMINSQASYNNAERGESWPSELAVAYYGKSDTNAVLNQIGAGRARVTVAMVSMTQLGLDVSRWTHVYVGVVPTSNPYNVYQLINRVCTPYAPDLRARLGVKPPSVVRVLIDEMSASVFCFARLFRDPDYGIAAGLLGRNYFGIKLWSASRETIARMETIAKFPKSYAASDAGVKTTLGKTRTGKTRRKNAWSKAASGVREL